MAEDKNGFLLYKDLIHSVKKLPKEKAGELFMHILQYVNDENPETDDLLIELAFEPVKQALKRDLKKYEQTKEKNRENARKRWHKPETEAMPKHATASDRIPPNAKHADIDIGSDSDSGSDTDILLEKETKDHFSKNVQDGKNAAPETSKKVAQKKVSIDELEMPAEFVEIWEEWRQYRKDRKLKGYAAAQYEQKAVNNLLEYSNKDPVAARQILDQSIANNYQGFFPLKNINNGPNQRFSSTAAAAAGNYKTAGKTSARTILAKRNNGGNAANGAGGNITIDVEAQ